jgi:class 3 adenylate cyclase
VARSKGTLDHFSGDGIMVFFNDLLPKGLSQPIIAHNLANLANALV